MEICYPNYDNSILSLISSILNGYHVPARHPGLALVDQHLAAPRKNTLLMVLDGLGDNALQTMLPPDSFLRSHQVGTLSSVYPCTTAAATTTLMSGLSPIEHGWLGWSPWFREFGRVVDIFLDRDSFSGAQVSPSPGRTLLPFEPIDNMIDRANPTLKNIARLNPSFDPNGFGSLSRMVEKIREICSQDGEQLILAYWHEPDTVMHNEGPYSQSVIDELIKIDQLLTDLYNDLKDTLFLITADHGQVEVEQEVYFDDLPELTDCLILPPTLETRAVSLFVKPNKLDLFVERFNNILGDSFQLMPRAEALERGLFGPGQAHSKVDDFLGDFLAMGCGRKIIRYHSMFEKPQHVFLGHHAGLCREEMIVPLIIARK